VGSDEPYLIDGGARYAAAATLVDRRKARGRRYPLALIVTLAVLAKLAGSRRVEALADWATLRCQDTLTGQVTTAVRYGVTSAPVTVRDAKGLLVATREHWGIETGLHRQRDGSLAEDGMRTRTGQAPHVLATLNTVVLSLLGRQGITHVAEAQRAIAYHRDRFLHQVTARRQAVA